MHGIHLGGKEPHRRRQSKEEEEQKSGHRSRRRLASARSARLAKSEAMPTRFEGGDRGQVHWTCGLGSLNRGGGEAGIAKEQVNKNFKK
jgi:hypothetical protein